MAKITIGGKEYLIPEMNFLAVERAWPYVTEATETVDTMVGCSAAIAIFASGLMEADDFKLEDYLLDPTLRSDVLIHQGVTRFLKKKLKGNEMSKVRDTMFEVLKEAGLEVTLGEAPQSSQDEDDLADPSLSTETAPDTSQSSSQPALKEEAGTP